jgi:hypothetical protein
MWRYLIPQIALRDLPPMIVAAACGGVLAGVYGIAHDQLTFSISPEYFTKLKFEQFRWADLGLPPRVLVAEIGFLATWWVGAIAAWFLARRLIPGQPRGRAIGQLATGFAIVFAAAMLAGGLGYLYGLWRGPAADYSLWTATLDELKIVDRWPFLRVAFIHNAGYLGGLAGLLAALIVVRPRRIRPAAADLSSSGV